MAMPFEGQNELVVTSSPHVTNGWWVGPRQAFPFDYNSLANHNS